MNIDERLETLIMNTKLTSREAESLRETVSSLRETSAHLVTLARQDGENIRALARIAESHERRLTDLEGGPA